MSSGNTKRKGPPGPLPPAKRGSGTREHQGVVEKCVTVYSRFIKYLYTYMGRPTNYCNECKGSYGSKQAHRAVCTRKTVSCTYPNLRSDGDDQPITLHCVDGYFKCIRCGKLLKKDQNMKVTSF